MSVENLMNINKTIVYKNGVIVGGIVYFSINYDLSTNVETGSDCLYEMLSAIPWEIVSNQESYEITLKLYSSDFVDWQEDGYTLNFVSGDNSKAFEGCQTRSTVTYADNFGRLVTELKINAERVV